MTTRTCKVSSYDRRLPEKQRLIDNAIHRQLKNDVAMLNLDRDLAAIFADALASEAVVLSFSKHSVMTRALEGRG